MPNSGGGSNGSGHALVAKRGAELCPAAYSIGQVPYFVFPSSVIVSLASTTPSSSLVSTTAPTTSTAASTLLETTTTAASTPVSTVTATGTATTSSSTTPSA